MDQDDGIKDVKPGEPGEIIIRGPQVMKGYWNRPEETEKSLARRLALSPATSRGWTRTDIYFIVDRKKDMIITGGFNIFPREVEEVLYEHPKVLEAAVIGVKDPRSGERVKAFVVLKDGQTATTDEIVAFCREKLTAYKVPKTRRVPQGAAEEQHRQGAAPDPEGRGRAGQGCLISPSSSPSSSASGSCA